MISSFQKKFFVLIILVWGAFGKATNQPKSVFESSNFNWAGMNNYYLWACNSSLQDQAFQEMQKAQMRVLRFFILANCRAGTNCRGYSPSDFSCAEIGDVESPVGIWQDKILDQIDGLMTRAYKYGIKLIISLHDNWSLGYWRQDAYVTKYNLSTYPHFDPTPFYQLGNAKSDFKNRLDHILDHVHPGFQKAYKELDEVVFAWEASNEPCFSCGMTSKSSWLEEMSQHIKSKSPTIPVSSGFYSGKQVPADQLAKIPSIDLLAIHHYGSNIFEPLQEFGLAAQKYNKQYFLEEFGASWNKSDPQEIINYYTMALTNATQTPFVAPWMFWQWGVSKEFNMQVNSKDSVWDEAILPRSLQARQTHTSQSWNLPVSKLWKKM